MTHRQYLGWVEWLKQRWNEPDRADYYAMQTAGALSGRALSDCRIRFDTGEGNGLSAEEVEAVWMARIEASCGHRSRKAGGKAGG